MSFEFSVSGVSYTIDSLSTMSCAICRTTGRALWFRKGEDIGICEPCSILAPWAWRQLAGEVPPGVVEGAADRISRVYVAIARRKRVPRVDAPSGASESERSIAAPAELDSSYEFMFVERPDGSLDLPFASNVGGRSLPSVALHSLSDIGLVSWEPLLEHLYTAYSPRGHLVAVVLARGWAESPQTPAIARQWRPWPISAHIGGMSGFWQTLESVWTLRLYKHCVMGEPEELCVRVREAARRYIDLQEAVRTGRAVDTDVSMLPALKMSMEADEISIARAIQLAADKVRNEKALTVRNPGPTRRRFVPKPKSATSDVADSENAWPELAIAPKSDRSTGSANEDLDDDRVPDEPDGGDDGDDDSEESDDESSDPTFVRSGRPLKQG